MTLSIELVLQVGGVILSVGVAWGLLKGKMDKLSEKIDTAATEALRSALDASRSAHRSHARLDDHSGRLTKVETGCIFHERRLTEALDFMRAEIASLRQALDKHVDATARSLSAMSDKLDAWRDESR